LPQNCTSIALLLFPGIYTITSVYTASIRVWLTVRSGPAVEKTLELGPIIIEEYTRDFALGLSSLIYGT